MKYFLKNAYLAMRALALRLILWPKKLRDFDQGSVDSILFIRIDRIGDVVVSLPAIEAFHAIFPRATISVLVKKENAPILKNIPWIDEIIDYEGFIRTALIIRKKRFSMAVDLLMDYSIRTALLAFLSGAGIKVGFDIERRGRVFSLALKPDARQKSMGENIMDLARFVGRACGSGGNMTGKICPKLFISDEDKESMEAFLREIGARENDMLIGVHPGGKFSSQRWPAEGFAELAERIRKRYNARILIFGGQEDAKTIKKIASLMETKPLVIVGLPLDKVAALVSMLNLLVCNNSGVLHIAAALEVPTVSTMGPTVPYLWWPQGEGHIVVRHELPCSPCSRAACKKHICLKSITVNEMEKAVYEQMNKISLAGNDHK